MKVSIKLVIFNNSIDFSFGEVLCEEVSKKEFDKFNKAITQIIEFLSDLFSGAADTIINTLEDERIPENVRDMLKMKMGKIKE